jgi:5'(3')-deoxyribonucleotidase
MHYNDVIMRCREVIVHYDEVFMRHLEVIIYHNEVIMHYQRWHQIYSVAAAK